MMCADMESWDRDGKTAWEAPSATALTDTESRADAADISLRNAPPSPGSIPG